MYLARFGLKLNLKNIAQSRKFYSTVLRLRMKFCKRFYSKNDFIKDEMLLIVIYAFEKLFSVYTDTSTHYIT